MEKICKLIDYRVADEQYQDDIENSTMLECTFISEEGVTFNMLVKVPRNSHVCIDVVSISEDVISNQLLYKN